MIFPSFLVGQSDGDMSLHQTGLLPKFNPPSSSDGMIVTVCLVLNGIRVGWSIPVHSRPSEGDLCLLPTIGQCNLDTQNATDVLFTDLVPVATTREKACQRKHENLRKE